MKLNYKRTVLVGFAFFLICAFWQVYDVTIAMTLTSKFGMSQTASGVVMALDNILALFMLPLFGGISDRCKSKSGRRTPFVRTGTILAVVFLMLLSLTDNAQLRNIEAYSKVNDPATMERIYDEQCDAVLKTPEGVEYKLSDLYTREEFAQLTTASTTTERNSFGRQVEVNLYTRHVVPARQACAAAVTHENPMTLVIFLGILLMLLISMATFRTPAVALMPDVTPKPLRSKANAIINLMGTAGGILGLVLGMVFATSAVQNALMSYTVYYGVIAFIMVGALSIFLFTHDFATLSSFADKVILLNKKVLKKGKPEEEDPAVVIDTTLGEECNLADEMADVMWVLVCLANQTGVDLEQAIEHNFRKKTERDKERHKLNPKL